MYNNIGRENNIYFIRFFIVGIGKLSRRNLGK